jgi:hypothetical protein
MDDNNYHDKKHEDIENQNTHTQTKNMYHAPS